LIEYKGINKISLVNNRLLLNTDFGDMMEETPYGYQFINGEKKEVRCKYVLKGNKISFELGKDYNPNYDLIIDPVLIFSSLTGSTADNWGFTATYDTLGNFYAGGIVGYSFPTPGVFTGSYPTTLGAYQISFAGGGPGGMGSQFRYDATVSKFSASGNSLIYSTYLGGEDNDQPHSMFVDNNGNLAIAGRTYSSSFPTTQGCFDPTFNGGADLFVTKFNSDGTALIGSTYIGGTGNDGENITPIPTSLGSLKHNYGDDARSEIICDANNNMWVAASTTSTNFPTQQPNQSTLSGMQDGVIFQLNNNCSNLIWSTYWGGSNNDACYVLTFDKSSPNILYVAGGTESPNFPITGGTLHPTFLGGTDGFLLKLNATTKALIAGTFIGTASYDQVYGVQTDDSNNVFVMGQTQGAFPIVGSVYSNPGSSQFTAKINSNLTTYIRSTVWGSGTTASTNVSPVAFLVDKCQNIYISGWGGPTGGNPGNTFGMPTTPGAIKTNTDGSDFYFIVFNKNFQSLLYASYFGQNGGGGEHVDGGTSRFDPNGVIYQAICAACGGGQSFPTTPGAYSTSNGSSNCNLGAVKIDFQLQNPDAQASAVGATIGCVPFTVQFVNTSQSATSYLWDFGDGSATTTLTNPTHTFTTAGNFVVRLIANNPNGCTALSDTAYINVTVKNDSLKPSFTAIKIDSCGPYTALFTNTSSFNTGPYGPGTSFSWNFGDGTSFNGVNPPLHVYPAAGTYTVTLTMTDTNTCNSPATFSLIIDYSSSYVLAAFQCPDSICIPAMVTFIDQSQNATSWNWQFGDGNSSSVSNPVNTYTTPGTYNVSLVAGNPLSCNLLDTAQKTIQVLPLPTANFTWAPNPSEPNTPTAFTNLSVGATKYLWNFGDGTTSDLKDPIKVYDKDGTYNVCLTVWNEYGCSDTVCRPVRGIVIPLVDVPTGFSPNGDGVNDVVYVKGYGIEKIDFKIYNRWGEKIFETTDKAIGWDGRYKGVMQEMEVYGYILNATFFDGTKQFKKGNITLIK
jgi:FOG: PKD repeat